MKKFLQKTYTWLVMLVAMFAMSTSAMAESVSFEYTWDFIVAHAYGANGYKEGPITANPQAYDWAGSFNLYDAGKDFGYLKVFPDDGYAITQVEIQASNKAQADQIFEISNKGSFNNVGSKAVWVGQETGELWFSCTGDNYYTTVTVTYEAAAASTTFAFSSTSIEDGDVYTEVVNYGLTLNHGGTLHFAEGKSVSDITVNGTPMDAKTYVLFNPSSTWINYTFGEDGANTIVIPEGVFVNDAGKTNEALTINFTINLPFFTMSSAEWTTFSGSSAWKMPAGYVGYIASDIENGQVVLTRKFEAGADIIGGYPVIINGPAAAKVVIEKGSSYSGDSQFLYANNSDYAQTYYASDMWSNMEKVAYCDDYTNCYVYKLSYDSNGENLGFYWDSADGRSIYCQPHKAFLVVPVSKLGADSNALKIRIADHTSGISTIVNENGNVIYNLQGQRVNATKPGVYVKNGKKFIVK